MKKFKTLKAMVSAIEAGEIPKDVISPGAAAAALGITRSSMHGLLKRGSVRSWWAEGYILVSTHDVKERQRQKLGIAEGQRELDIAA